MNLLYNIADLYISPYRGEGFNMPVLEAMSVGLPVLVSAGGSTDDFVPFYRVNKFQSFITKKDGYTIATIYYFAIEDNKPRFVEIIKQNTFDL